MAGVSAAGTFSARVTSRVRNHALLQFLESRGWTQGRLAAEANVDQTFVSCLVNLRFECLPRKTLTSSRIGRVVKVTGLSYDQLIPESLAGVAVTRTADFTVDIDPARLLDAGSGTAPLLLPDPSDAVATKEEVETLLDVLTEREADIVRRQYGVDNDVETLESIAKAHGISRERVRQLGEQALHKMQRAASLLRDEAEARAAARKAAALLAEPETCLACGRDVVRRAAVVCGVCGARVCGACYMAHAEEAHSGARPPAQRTQPHSASGGPTTSSAPSRACSDHEGVTP